MEHNQEHHQMVLERTYGSGAEEWHCPSCGRRFIMIWTPAYKRIILESGDEYAVHSGGKGIPGLITPHLGANINKTSPDDEATKDDPLMGPWLDWMESSDFENLWGDQNS